jgi:hypothetical protein
MIVKEIVKKGGEERGGVGGQGVNFSRHGSTFLIKTT